MGSFEQTSSREALLNELRGQEFTVRPLQSFFKHLPKGVNEELPQLEKDVDEFLEKLFPPGQRLEAMKKLKGAYFGATWYPYASLETLRASTFVAIWLFAWDDEVDSTEFSNLVNSYEAANAFRNKTVRHIHRCLYPKTVTIEAETITNPILAAFKDIADAITSALTQSQIDNLYHEFVFWIEMTDLEHRFHLGRELPSVEEYQEIRMGSGAVGVTLALIEINDILSLKKEIAQGQVVTLVPLIFKRVGSAQMAVDTALDSVSASLKSFELQSQKLLEEHSSDPITQGKLQKYILGCKYFITGNLSWSLASGRYKIGAQTAEGAIIVRL
ncbi:hypothetical protein MMC10_009893 [Thelotrema lepadinum]|nr:hypothetical protein [Thelotrema lepadinum]